MCWSIHFSGIQWNFIWDDKNHQVHLSFVEVHSPIERDGMTIKTSESKQSSHTLNLTTWYYYDFLIIFFLSLPQIWPKPSSCLSVDLLTREFLCQSKRGWERVESSLLPSERFVDFAFVGFAGVKWQSSDMTPIEGWIITDPWLNFCWPKPDWKLILSTFFQREPKRMLETRA